MEESLLTLHHHKVPELEELLSIPAEALQKELCLSREEVCVCVILFTMITIITNTWKFFMMSAIIHT